MPELYIVKAKVKELAEEFDKKNKKGYSVASDFSDELNNKVKDMILKALERAKANHRRTLMAKDV